MGIGIAAPFQREDNRDGTPRISGGTEDEAIRFAFARLVCDTPDLSLIRNADAWHRIKRDSRRHGMGPLVAYSARPHVSPEERQWADQILRGAWRRHEQMLRGLDSLLQTLERAGVRPVVLKGPVLGLRHYDPPFVRKPSIDLDLGIARDDLEQACRVLLSAGYTMGARIEDEIRDNHHVALSHPSMPLVELHFRLSHRALGPRIEPFLERARPFRLPSGREVSIPDASDEIFHLMVHHAGGAAIFFHLWELRRLWSRASAEVRERAIETAAANHFSGVLDLVDAGLRKYWGETLLAGRTRPKTWRKRRAPAGTYDEFERLWEPGLAPSAGIRLRRRWLELRLMERPSDAFRLLLAVGRIARGRIGSTGTSWKHSVLSARNAPSLLVRLPVRCALHVYGACKQSALFCIDGSYREVLLLRLFRSAQLHQSTVHTGMDRYPKIFAACRDHLVSRADPRVLSFGCATGEEVVTLRKYFPNAFLVGAEINRHSLRACRKRMLDDRTVFVESDAREIGRLGPFDAVFCMAVLQRTPMQVISEGLTNLKQLYPFEKFDEKVSELDSWLKPGGILVIHHSQYLLADSTAGNRYAPLPAAGHIQSPGPHFDRNSELRRDAAPAHSVFVKLRD